MNKEEEKKIIKSIKKELRLLLGDFTPYDIRYTVHKTDLIDKKEVFVKINITGFEEY